MKTSFALFITGMFTVSAYALPDYDPFADATGSGGTSYTAGANLIGQTDAQGQTWLQAGPTSATQPTIASGSLSYAGLPASQGNSVTFGGNGESARLNTAGIVGTGTIYYSFIMNISSAPTAGSSGIFFAGFNNSTGSQATTPTTVATRVYAKGFGTTFQLGLSKNSSTASDWVFDPTSFNVGSTLFVVGSYTFNTATASDDVAQMWINPTVGGLTAPTADLTASTGADIALSQVASFLLMDRSASELGGTMDEVRIGTSWGDVTGVVAAPEPSTLALGGFGALALVSLYRARRR